MDYIKILKRSWEILWRYRALWIFGILVALTAGGSGGNGGTGYQFNGGDFSQGQSPFPGWEMPHIGPEIVGTLIAIGVVIVVLILLLGVVFTIIRYIASVALIRMMDRYEETGEKVSVWQGFRLGWSRSAWRLFLIDLVTGIPAILGALLLIALSLAPLLLWTTHSNILGAAGTVAAIGLFFLVILFIIIVFVALGVFKEFFWRTCILEGKGVIDSIRQGFAMVKRRLGNVALMWLIMLGVGLGFTILMIPVVLLLIVLGLAIGGAPGYLAGLLVNQVAQGAAPWIIGALVGVPIFILVIGVPSLFLGGLYQVFTFNVWTLTYRELRVLEQVAGEPLASMSLPEPPVTEELTDQA